MVSYAGNLRPIVCYCHDVLQMDTTEAEEYLATACKQLARQTPRRQSGRAQLALQRMLPLGRGAEFATMEIVDQRHHPLQSTRITGKWNACVISSDGQVSPRLEDYKTVETHGEQVTDLSSNEECRKHIIPVMLVYIDKWCPLRAGRSHSVMFSSRIEQLGCVPVGVRGTVTEQPFALYLMAATVTEQSICFKQGTVTKQRCYKHTYTLGHCSFTPRV